MTIGNRDVSSFKAKRETPFGVLACLLVFLLFVASCSGSESPASGMSQEEGAESSADRPNVVFVLADDPDCGRQAHAVPLGQGDHHAPAGSGIAR